VAEVSLALKNCAAAAANGLSARRRRCGTVPDAARSTDLSLPRYGDAFAARTTARCMYAVSRSRRSWRSIHPCPPVQQGARSASDRLPPPPLTRTSGEGTAGSAFDFAMGRPGCGDVFASICIRSPFGQALPRWLNRRLAWRNTGLDHPHCESSAGVGRKKGSAWPFGCNRRRPHWPRRLKD